MTFESNLLYRDKYQNSSLILIPWYLKTLSKNGTIITEDYLRRHVHHKMSKTREATLRRLFENLANQFPSYREHFTMCKKTCNQESCHMESLIPTLLNTALGHHPSDFADDPYTFPRLKINVYPPNDVTMVVTSQAKMTLIDFVVYVLSCLNFWFGFCPLQLSDFLANATQYLSLKYRTNKVSSDAHCQQTRCQIERDMLFIRRNIPSVNNAHVQRPRHVRPRTV